MTKILGLDFVTPEEMAMLQRIFDAVCDDPDKKSPAADDDALLVVALFRSGFREENKLMNEVRRRKGERVADPTVKTQQSKGA